MNNWVIDNLSKLSVLSDGSKSVKSLFNRLSTLIITSMYDDNLYYIQYIKPQIEHIFQQLISQNTPVYYNYAYSENYENSFIYLNNMLCASIWERKQLLDPINFGLEILFNQTKHGTKIKICQCWQPNCIQVHANLCSLIVDMNQFDNIKSKNKK